MNRTCKQSLQVAVIAVAVLLASCTQKAPTATPPATGISNLVLALDAIEVSCAAALPNVTNPLASAWLQTCPTAVTASITAVSAPNATVAALGALGATGFVSINLRSSRSSERISSVCLQLTAS